MSTSYLCVDANLVIRLIVDPIDETIQTLWDRWDAEHRHLVAPTLLPYEVTNALYRYQKLGYMSRSAVQLGLEAALALPIELHSDPDLHWRALRLAESLDLPATYDANYLATALTLEADFWTADSRLARRVQSSLSWVHLVEIS